MQCCYVKLYRYKLVSVNSHANAYNLFLLAILKYRISASIDDVNLWLQALAELFVANLSVVVLIKLQHPLIDLMLILQD